MISAIVLAAGQATRFGECKQLALLDGKPLLQHTLDGLAQSKVDDVVVVLGAYADQIRQKIAFGKARIAINPDYAEGMSTSLQTGLRAVPDSRAAVIVLGDQPFVASATIDGLIAEYRRKQASVVIPTYNGFRGNPVLVDASLFPEMMQIRGDIGCRAIFGDHAEGIAKIAVDDRGIITDVDTREDLLGVINKHPLKPVLHDIQETIVDLRKRGQPFAVATVVRAERPTSSKPGDKAIIAPDGTLTGWIGGSCAHDIVVTNALEALDEGTPRFLTLSSVPEGKRQGVIDIPMRCYSGGVLDVFIEPNLPTPQMIVVGYETVARAMVRFSKTLHFEVTVVDPLATAGTIPEADRIVNELNLTALPMTGEVFIVIATHGRFDEEALEQAVASNASYIALVASPKRAGVIIQQLRERGVSGVERIKSPAGLNIGAEGAEEIALSIAAEIVQERRAGRLNKPLIAKVEAAAEAIDPICNMTVSVADARYTAEHRGRRYYFCCAHCKSTFEKEPERYANVA